MTFDEVLKQVKELLREQKRTSYRGLKRRFDLDEEYLEDLKAELIGALRLAVDEDGLYLVWVGDATLGDHSSPQPSPQRGEGESPRPTGERARVRGMEDNLYALKQLILEKTEGTPFFMEEVVQTLKAVEYLGLAGQQAVQHSAYAEAISHLTTALELLKTLPDTPERVQQELALQLTLGVPVQILKGHAAPEVGKTYNRVLELCGQVGETSHLFPALFGLWRFYFLRPDAQKARELAEQMMRLAQNSQDSALLLEAHQALGASLLWLGGELRQGRRHLEHGIALYDIQKRCSHAFRYGIDPGVYCLCFAALNLWCLGYPDQALKSTQDALHLAHELAHPHTLAFALQNTAMFHQFRQETTAVREQAEASLTLSTEHGFVYRAAWATIWRGWVLAAQGQTEEGVVRMQEGVAAQRATGAELLHPYFLALLAEIYRKMGQPEEGLATLAEASALMQRTGERWYEAELYRLRGKLMLQQANQKSKGKSQKSKIPDSRSLTPDPFLPNTQHLTPSTQEAEACFHKAIAIAQKQQAKSLELRAVMSLARLWQSQGKKTEAHQMLAEIYGWFTEGFDTKDLQEAKGLLAELA